MPRFWDFSLPTQVQFGRGGLRRIGQFAAELGTSVLLVGYRDQAGLEEVYAKAEKLLGKSGLKTTALYTIPPDPDVERVEAGAEVARRRGVDVVVALGGGSVIDAAKGIAALARVGGSLWDHATANPQSRPVLESLPVLAVPTTAGTGSEVSNVAVFTFGATAAAAESAPLKDAIVGPALRPRLALVDADLALGSSPGLTAACGADALGHAIESCLSRRANPIASALAAEAVRLIVDNLPRAVAEPENGECREPLAAAATMAGAAFSAAGVVVSHAVAQAHGAVLHLPHGLSVALATRVGLDFNRSACASQYAELARACRLPGEDENLLADRFVAKIHEVFDRCDLPSAIPAPQGDPNELVQKLVQSAMASSRVPITQNPQKVAPDDLAGLFARLLA
ncbi:MAG: iron-containing alcohol dehydrogenase family protein [Thermoguttaceae bacterium]